MDLSGEMAILRPRYLVIIDGNIFTKSLYYPIHKISSLKINLLWVM